ncbi:BTB/POZ domain-containing protein SR1IP1-like isoform X2 [Andrographis paniculata]|nr:BTB/POZ domain-containing protein SR1IP1-like isoform X2 [Andrographis paniculata]XP_051117209.1 BTB/POZ domain-containing protein SR1IP1-like isoform X2 [Andrographis paniculata]
MSCRKELLSDAMKRTSEWILSLEIPSDITVNVGGTSFALHKFPLVSKCGYIRKLVTQSSGVVDCSVLDIPDVPGGAAGFEFAAKFCYGISFSIAVDNAAMVRCVAEFLEMTEEYGPGNLIVRTEEFVNDEVLKSLTGAVSVLHSSERFIPMAERVNLVSRCVDTVAFLACQVSQFVGMEDMASSGAKSWAKCLIVLRIDFFRRIVVAMIARGLNERALILVLMLYARESLRDLEVSGEAKNNENDRKYSHEKRVVLETIVSLLPRDRNTVPVTFLSTLLRAAMFVETTVACRLDLEKRIATQLDNASLEDLLFPANSITDDTLFDIETAKRIMLDFLEFYVKPNEKGFHFPPSPSAIEQATRLMENYLTHVASDPNLSVLEFVSLAEVIPRQHRWRQDGIYGAIDAYFKAHPALSDTERKKVCNAVDFEKLSPEPRAHAETNDRLPVETIVRLICHERRHSREWLDDEVLGSPGPRLATDEALRLENRELRMEVVEMKRRLKEMEKEKSCNEVGVVHWKSFVSSISRRFSKFVVRGNGNGNGNEP